MYNYNLINPINITYRNQKQNPYAEKNEDEVKDGAAQNPVSLDENRGQRQFPNGNKVQVDYAKNKINIAQVVEDFKSTIAAINAPKEVSDEVYLYLNLVENESKKENPSREIILSNLKNASKISDKFIEDSLKKPSTVVEDWVNALFLQKVELKSNPDFVNEAFRVQIPEKKKAAENIDIAPIKADEQNTAQKIDFVEQDAAAKVASASNKTLDKISASDDFQKAPLNIYNIPQNQITVNEIKPIGQASSLEVYGISSAAQNQITAEIKPQIASGNNINLTYSTTAPLEESSFGGAASFVESIDTEDVSDGVYRLNATVDEPEILGSISSSGKEIQETAPERIVSLKPVISENEQMARSNFTRAKRLIKENGNPKSALKLYDEALKLVENSNDVNLKAAIHFERGRVFDDYDYAEYALKDYNDATKCSDNNLKTHAHLKMGRIYDDYVMFDPAVEHYSIAVETSEEAKNPAGKTKALRYLAGLFADRYDKENTEIFNSLSIDSAYETGNQKIVAKTLMEAAENFEYIGEDIKALNTYKLAARELFELQDYNMLSLNYEAASDIMEKLGNKTKAMSLLSKALLYRQKAELQTA